MFQHAVNTAITGPAASTQSHLAPLSAEPRLLSRFHLLLFIQSQPLTETDSFKIILSHGKTLNEDPEHITPPHAHVFTLLLLGLNKTPPQHCQGQDFCLVTGLDVCVCRLSADVGGRCVYVYRLLMILHPLFSTFSIPFLYPISSHVYWLSIVLFLLLAPQCSFFS